MTNYNWNEEDINKVEKFIDINNRGYYVSSKELQEVYNRVLNKNLNPTNCGSCLKNRVRELESALNAYKASQTVKTEPMDNNTVDEVKEPQKPLKRKKKDATE